jgi:hypothetical protein
MRTLLCLALLGVTGSYDAQDAERRYELKCLYCHSSRVVEEQPRSAAEWRKVLSRMRARAPLLLSRDDIRVLYRYITSDLRLATRSGVLRRPPPAVVPAQPLTPTVVEPDAGALDAALPPEEEPAPPLVAAEPAHSDPEADALGPALLEEKCSKCHALTRVYTKLDSLEKAISTVERMRRKTGSGISRDDALLLERFLRAQF